MSTDQNKPNDDRTKTKTVSNQPQWILDFENSDTEASNDHLKKQTEGLEIQLDDIQADDIKISQSSELTIPVSKDKVGIKPTTKVFPRAYELQSKTNKIKQQAENKPAEVQKSEAKVNAKPTPKSALKADESKPLETNKIKQQAKNKPVEVKKPEANVDVKLTPKSVPKTDGSKPVEANKIKQQAKKKPVDVKKLEAKVDAKPTPKIVPKIDESKPVEVNKIKQQAEKKSVEVKKPEVKADIKIEPIDNSKIDVEKNKKPKTKPQWLGKFLSLLLFIFLVVLPWIGVIGYVTRIAQPRYVSTSEVVVKQVGDTSVSNGTGISAMLGVNNTSVEDARYLTQYILSNDMVKRLDKTFNFRKEYYTDGKDFVYELTENATQEELFEYFKKRVKVNLNEQTNILTVSTEGFNADYALALNKAIVRDSEGFVNKISQEIAGKQSQESEKQLAKSQNRLNIARQNLLNFQNQTATIDPTINVQSVSQLIGSLQAQLASLRTEERQLLSYLNPDAPQIISIRSQVAAVQTQIAEEKSKLTSRDNSKLNTQTIQFEAIKAEVDFATEMYKIALSSSEKSHLEANRKMKNLITISSAHKAEDALYPRVNYIIWTSLAFLLIFYGFIRLVMAVIKDHAS